jgi:hypothetical protein
MRELFIGTAGDFAQALEDWIIDNKCNPKTQEEWARCLKDIAEKGNITSLGVIKDKDVNQIKNDLNNNFNVENL